MAKCKGITAEEYDAEVQRLTVAINAAYEDLIYYVGHTLTAPDERFLNEDFTLSVRCLLILRNLVMDRVGLEEVWTEQQRKEAKA